MWGKVLFEVKEVVIGGLIGFPLFFGGTLLLRWAFGIEISLPGWLLGL